jgi:hypothetical protein
MKGAASLEFAARLLELNSFADDLDDVRASDQVVNKILRNQSGHNDLNGNSGAAGLTLLLLFRLA